MLETLDALVQNFKPIESIANTLNVKYLKDDVKIKNTINKFSVVDGRVLIEEFPTEIKDVKMSIGGSHGFDQSIDYLVKMAVPKELIGKGKLGGLADSGFDFLNSKAAEIGLDLNTGNTVHVTLQLLGDIKKPQIKVKKVSLSEDGETTVKDAVVDSIKDLGDKAVDSVKTIVNDKVDEATQIVEDKVDEIKDQVTDKIDEKVDEVTEQVTDKIEEAVGDKIEEVAGDKVDEVKDQIGGAVGDKIDDALDGKGDQVKDAIKDGIGGFKPPWKKKDKENKDE